MKKILIVFPSSMQIGGIEKSLIGLLDKMRKDSRFDVDCFLFGHHGPLYPYIEGTGLLTGEKELYYLQQSFLSKLRHGTLYAAWRRLCCFFQKEDFYAFSAQVHRKKAPVLQKEYDLALGFFLPFDFLKENVTAKVKIGWVHTDYASAKCNQPALQKQYEGLDYIVAVSDSVAESFQMVFPRFRDRVIVIENILPVDLIKTQARVAINDMPEDESIRLLSVGRFCEAKNFDNVPEICSLLVEAGLNVKWYLIGFGGYEKLIRQKITEFHMENRVVILGKKENPYPYMARCNLYIQPSRYPAKAVTVREAQTLGKPVVITAFPTAKSQLKDGIDGIIVPMDNKGCAKGIAELLCNSNRMQELSRTCLMSNYSNEKEVEKFLQILEKENVQFTV